MRTRVFSGAMYICWNADDIIQCETEVSTGKG